MLCRLGEQIDNDTGGEFVLSETTGDACADHLGWATSRAPSETHAERSVPLVACSENPGVRATDAVGDLIAGETATGSAEHDGKDF